MADPLSKYKNIPVTGLDLSKLKKFLGGNGPYITILPPGLLPKGATVTAMVLQCQGAIEELYSKYLKYKELGYVKDEMQMMALGQLSNNSKTITNYLIARSWSGRKVAEKANELTKAKLVTLINNWLTNHRDRIGMETVSVKPIILTDPKDKQKRIKYYLSDNYHKPINQAYYPHNYRGHRDLGRISISVAQAESLLIQMVDNYVNENDMVFFTKEMQAQADAFTVIRTLSGYPTQTSKTFKGVKYEFIKTVNSILDARERRKRAMLEKAREEMTEAELLARTSELDRYNAQYLKDIERLQDAERKILINRQKLLEEGNILK